MYCNTILPILVCAWVLQFRHGKHSCLLQRGTPVAEATEKDNNQPQCHIVMFQDDDDHVDTVLNQYFVSVEQELMMETSTLISSIFFAIAAHYIFNLTYHWKSGDVWVFIQEKVLGLTSKSGTKRSPSSMSHFSGIQRVYDALEKTQEE